MRLISLHVQRMPGFKEKGFSYPEGLFKKGINLIIGSNGSGKTTSCLALRKLLWPEHPSVKDLSPVSLFSRWEESGELVQIEVEGSRHLSSAQVALPPEQDAFCYTILLDDLFSATDTEFAKTISKIAFGGCDIEAMKAHFELPVRWGLREKKQLHEKKRALIEVARGYQELHEEEEGLKGLAQEVRESKAAKETLYKIQTIKELHKKKSALAYVETALSSLLPGAAYVREEDLKDYQLIIAQEEMDKDLFFVDELQLPFLEEAIRELQELERDLREEKRRALELEVDFKERFSLLEIGESSFPKIQMSKVSELQRLWENWHEKSCAAKEWDARLQAIGSQTEPSYPTELLREGVRLLFCFLQAEEQKWLRSILWCTPLLSLMLYEHPYICFGAALLSCGVIYLLKQSSSLFFKRSFLTLGLPPPLDWSPEEVRVHISRLEALWGEAVRFLSDKETAQIIAVQKKMCTEEAGRLYRGLTEAGFDETKLSWIPFLHGLQRAQDLFFESKKQEALVSDGEKKRQFIIEQLNVRSTQEALLLLAQNRKALQRQKELKELSLRKKEILVRCKIENADSAETWPLLRKSLEQKETYLQLTQEKAVLEQTVRDKENKLKENIHLLELAGDELAHLEETLRLQASVHDKLLQKIAATEQKLQMAREREVFENLSAEIAEAENALQKMRIEGMAKTLAEFFIDKIEKRYSRDFQPEVFKKAGDWFNSFTRGAYQLKLISKVGFVAFDVKIQENKQIVELSRGTRIQLIFAVRLAFMEAAEGSGPKLPLLLDEAMSHADDERFQYMVQALEEVAKTGRQVFYFTCQKGCLHAWQAAASKNTPLNLIDLDQVKQESGCKEIPLIPIEKAPPLPSPEGKTLSQYAEILKAPGVDPLTTPFGWHISHFLSSAEELHACALQSIFYYGQYKNLIDKGVLHNSKVIAKGRLSERYHTLISIGIGRKCTYEDLERGGVSDKFLDKVWECARLCDYSPLRLLEALEEKQVSGFREKAREELQAYLIEIGCLDLEEPLSQEVVRAELWKTLTEEKLPLSPEEARQFINNLPGIAQDKEVVCKK